MNNVSFDIKMTSEVIYNHSSDNYKKIYMASNENLFSLFSNIDVKDKKVLSVVGSGDQAFHFYNNGADVVDVFDINKLALYHYYLRIWQIQYYGKFYISSYSIKKLKSILKYVVPKNRNEKLALEYWNLFIKRISSSEFKRLFITGGRKNIIKNIDLILDKLLEYNYKLYNFDIFQRKKINSKYDIIYVSNISEWISNNVRVYSVYENNLYNLLNDGGFVLSSHVSYGGVAEDELQVFQRRFQYEELGDNESSLGYVYKK